MYINGKMRPAETTPGMGKEGNKGEFKYAIFDIL
jgi:hypothetical protein